MNSMSINLEIPRFIAHRGVPAHAPENTIASLRKAHELGATWIEFDVQLTKDNKAIIMHDHSVNRTTNGKGKVSQLNFAEISALDAGNGQHVPLLERWLGAARELGLGVDIEIKESAARADTVAKIIYEMLLEHWVAELPVPLITSSRADCLQAFHNIDSEVPKGLIIDTWPLRGVKKFNKLPIQAIVVNYKRLNEKRVAQLHDLGLKVLAYTVNDKALADKLFKMGVDSLFTDDISLLQ